MSPTILIVDDDEAFRRFLADVLDTGGYRLQQAASGDEALRILSERAIDLVLTDQRMPGLDGIELVRRARAAADPPAVVVMTAFGTIPQAVEAVRLGASDYVTKPLESPEALRVLVRRVLEQREERTQEPHAFITRDPKTLELLALADRAAATDATVLVTGESGTGKELIARRIHAHSPRSHGPFVAVNGAAIPDALAESELFGHEKGAFTGADTARSGRFEQAAGGTLFLDEIGELSEAVQAKLLRALEEKRIERIGSDASVPVDLRLVAATNRDLASDVEQGRFRSDLYYRLDVVRLAIPALRDRPGDLDLLVPALIESLAGRLGVPPRPLSAEAMDRLRSYAWPGNVRELRNVLERALIVAPADAIGPADLPGLEAKAGAGTDEDGDVPQAEALSLRSRERQAILEALERTGGHREKAAGLLGISVRTLYSRLRAYDIR